MVICGVTFFVLVFLEDGVVTAGSETVPSRATPAEIFIFTGIQLGLCCECASAASPVRSPS